MFAPYEYGADIIDNSREFTVNAIKYRTNVYIQKLPALSEGVMYRITTI